MSTVSAFGRAIRRVVNPLSTGLTMRWHGAGVRRGPAVPLTPPSNDRHAAPYQPPSATAGVCEASPGHWIVPAGQRPGWSWLPPQGAIPQLRAVPPWVRVWYRLPLVDRYAYSYMWHHGGWAVLPLAGDDTIPPPAAGQPAPNRPVGPHGDASAG